MAEDINFTDFAIITSISTASIPSARPQFFPGTSFSSVRLILDSALVALVSDASWTGVSIHGSPKCPGGQKWITDRSASLDSLHEFVFCVDGVVGQPTPHGGLTLVFLLLKVMQSIMSTLDGAIWKSSVILGGHYCGSR